MNAPRCTGARRSGRAATGRLRSAAESQPRRAGAAALLAATLLAAAASVSAQGVRATAVTTARYVGIRPLVRDSVSRDLVTQLPDGTFAFQGQPVFCAGTLPCVFYRSLDVENAVAIVQDVDLTAWGLGLPGLSVTAALRGRARLSGDFIWPQSDDAFDALLAYAEYDRDPFRFRIGRQRTLGGLGFYGYDGASVLYEPAPRIAVEAYGGWSLARGLYEPRSDALRGFEDFLPDRDAYLFGAWAEVEPAAGTVMAARYQREIWSDHSALLSERASLDIRTDLLEPVAMITAADYDFAFGRIGKANVTARLPFSRLTLEATARRYVPYFELWTIWGFFSPVAYNEVELLASWRAAPQLAAWASAGWRKYEDAQAPIVLSRLKDEAVRIGVGATYTAPNNLTLMGEYAMERGFGAFLMGGDLSVRWQPHPRAVALVGGTAFQQIEQFRVGEGIVFGGTASLDVDVTARVGLGAGFGLYRQTYDNRPSSADWNQQRGWASLRVFVGSDPGLAARTRP